MPGLTPILFVDRKRAVETQVIAFSPTTTTMPAFETRIDNPTYPAPTQTDQNAPSSGLWRVLVPFEGGRLDRKALRLALRLSLQPGVFVTVLHISMVDRTNGAGTNGDSGTNKQYGAIAYISKKLHDTKVRIFYFIRKYAMLLMHATMLHSLCTLHFLVQRVHFTLLQNDKLYNIDFFSECASRLRRRTLARNQTPSRRPSSIARHPPGDHDEHRRLRRGRMQTRQFRFGHLESHRRSVFGTAFRSATTPERNHGQLRTRGRAFDRRSKIQRRSIAVARIASRFDQEKGQSRLGLAIGQGKRLGRRRVSIIDQYPSFVARRRAIERSNDAILIF